MEERVLTDKIEKLLNEIKENVTLLQRAQDQVSKNLFACDIYVKKVTEDIVALEELKREVK